MYRFSRFIFLSTPSARRATYGCALPEDLEKISIHALREEGDPVALNVRLKASNFYPRPPRGGRHPAPAQNTGRCRISIHALREEGDRADTDLARHKRISIHALREEGDEFMRSYYFTRKAFLSTPSARRATFLFRLNLVFSTISIHALREEGDRC